MECDLLVNHRSRSGKQEAPLVSKALSRNGFKVRKTYAISRHYSLEEAVRDVVNDLPRLLVIAGGDGTISSVLNHLAGEEVEVGVVPLGTTNNFARSLDIPLDLDSAVKAIATRRGAFVDLGTINGMYFTNVASIGISAEIAQHVTNKAKRRWGRLAYGIEGIKRLITHRPFIVTIQDIHRNLMISLETHQVVIANGRYHAGREIAEDAAIDDGELIIFALGGGSKLDFLKHMIDFYIGKRRRIVHSSYFVGKNVKVTTSRGQPVEIDGEVKEVTPLTAAVKSGAIKVRFK